MPIVRMLLFALPIKLMKSVRPLAQSLQCNAQVTCSFNADGCSPQCQQCLQASRSSVVPIPSGLPSAEVKAFDNLF